MVLYYYERLSGFSADPIFFPLTKTPDYANLTFRSTDWNFKVTEWNFTPQGQWVDPSSFPPFQFRSISTNPDQLNYQANCWWMGPLDDALLESNTVLNEMMAPLASCHDLDDFYLTVCDQVGLIAERYPTYWIINDEDMSDEPLFVGTESGNIGVPDDESQVLCTHNALTTPVTRQYGNIDGISWYKVTGTADVYVWSDPLEGSWTLDGGYGSVSSTACPCACNVPDGGFLWDPSDQCSAPPVEEATSMPPVPLSTTLPTNPDSQMEDKTPATTPVLPTTTTATTESSQVLSTAVASTTPVATSIVSTTPVPTTGEPENVVTVLPTNSDTTTTTNGAPPSSGSMSSRAPPAFTFAFYVVAPLLLLWKLSYF